MDERLGKCFIGQRHRDIHASQFAATLFKQQIISLSRLLMNLQHLRLSLFKIFVNRLIIEVGPTEARTEYARAEEVPDSEKLVGNM